MGASPLEDAPELSQPLVVLEIGVRDDEGQPFGVCEAAALLRVAIELNAGGVPAKAVDVEGDELIAPRSVRASDEAVLVLEVGLKLG